MSDNCGGQDSSSNDLNLNLTDDATQSLAIGTACTSGIYKPSNDGEGDVFPAPAPATYGSFLHDFEGEDANGAWKLFALDDNGSDAGLIRAWGLNIETRTAQIVIPATGSSGVAAPYPAVQYVKAPPGEVVADVELNFGGFSHLNPDDVDILLADEQGDSAVVMSDACGDQDIHLFNWSFSDLNPTLLDDDSGGGCGANNVIPTAYGPDPDPTDSWPLPAPTPSLSSFSEAFTGTEGGVWSLFVTDDSPGATGYVDTWTLSFTTRPATSLGFNQPTLTAPEGAEVPFAIDRNGPTPFGPAKVKLSASAGSARPGEDFNFPTRTVEIDRKLIRLLPSVMAKDDGIAEKAETFRLNLSDPEGDALLSDGTRSITVTIPASKNATLKLGKLKLKRKKGTGTLAAAISSPGKVTIAGSGLKKMAKTMKKPGKVLLPLRPTGKAKRSLRRTGKANLRAKVTYVTLGGRKVTRKRKLTLRL
jgi:hypothetical protein